MTGDRRLQPQRRSCLVKEPTMRTCKQLGGDSCKWNMDALVDCPYVRGDDVDVTEWEID